LIEALYADRSADDVVCVKLESPALAAANI